MTSRHVYLGTAALVASLLLLAAGYRWGWQSRPEEDMARKASKTLYVIQEFIWRWRGNRVPVVLDEGRPGKPVLAFTDRARADAHCQQLHLQKRATVNPFRHLPEEGEYSTLSAAAFLALLRAEGLTPPADFPSPGDDDLAWTWADWWEENRSGWDEALAARLWNALDRVHFYEVLEVPLQP